MQQEQQPQQEQVEIKKLEVMAVMGALQLRARMPAGLHHFLRY
jgi:hypothetical protein